MDAYLFNPVLESLSIVVAVGKAHDIKSRWHVQRVVGVEITTENTASEPLQPEKHARRGCRVRIYTFRRVEPVHEHALEKHISSAI